MSCAGNPLPSMFVSRDYDHCVIGNYLKKKHGALSSLIGKPETTSLYFSSADFNSLIDQAAAAGATGLRMYFASYCPTGYADIDKLVTAGYDKLLTLIFAPTKSDPNSDPGTNPTDTGQYFIFNPNGGVISILMPIAQMLVAAYSTDKVPLLQAVIADCGNPNFQETQSMWLSLDKFNGPLGLLKEIDCQGACGLSAFIGTYPVDYILPERNVNVSWQLTVIFELAKTISYLNNKYIYHFDIEDTAGFSARLPANPALGDKAAVHTPPVNQLGDNTLNPCPPSTSNCGALVPSRRIVQ